MNSVVKLMGEFDVRPMAREDLPAVLEIEQQVYPFPWAQQIFVGSMEAGTLLVVLQRQQQVVGYGVLSTAAGESQLLNLALSPHYQGRGLGRALLQWLIEQARQGGADILFLEVRLSNDTAQQLYQSLGFNEIGVRKQYYRVIGGRREDALIYALQIMNEDYFLNDSER